MDFEGFKNEWLGRTIDYDHQWNFQCVDLIRQYIYECYGIAGGGGVPSAISYWGYTPAAILERFFKIQDNDVHAGDIVILYGLGGNTDGHIGIATGNQMPTQVEILEQNGSTGNGKGEGGDAIRTRYVDKARLAGLLRPYELAPIAPPVPLYTVEQIPEKLVKVNKDPTYKWGMNYEFDYMKDHPIDQLVVGTVLKVVAVVHHKDGYDYYKTSMEDPDGYNVLDCDDYTPPPPPEPVYVPPAAPLPIPTSTEPYPIHVDLPGYTSSNAAVNDLGEPVTVPKSDENTIYYKFSQRVNDEGKVIAYNVTRTPGTPGAWINPDKNVLPPPLPPPPNNWTGPREDSTPPPPPMSVPILVSEPEVVVSPNDSSLWKGTVVWFHPDHSPDKYELQTNVTARDLSERGEPQAIKAIRSDGENVLLDIFATFYRDGVKYYLLHMASDIRWEFWYGIPVLNAITRKPYLLKLSELQELFESPIGRDVRAATHTLHFSDKIAEAFARVGKVWDVVRKLKVKK